MSQPSDSGGKLGEGDSPLDETSSGHRKGNDDLVPNGNEVEEDQAKEANPYLVTWDESDAHQSPRNWSKRYRNFFVFIVSLYTLLSPICSTMNAPALGTLQREFHVTSDTLANMMMSASMLAFTIAPIMYGPLSERVGRKYVLQVSNLMYVSLATHSAS